MQSIQRFSGISGKSFPNDNNLYKLVQVIYVQVAKVWNHICHIVKLDKILYLH